MGPLEAFDQLVKALHALQGGHLGRDQQRWSDLVRHTLRVVGYDGTQIVLDPNSFLPVPTAKIHIRHHGSTLCGNHRPPYEWPKGEECVLMQDASKATCTACQDAYIKGMP